MSGRTATRSPSCAPPSKTSTPSCTASGPRCDVSSYKHWVTMPKTSALLLVEALLGQWFNMVALSSTQCICFCRSNTDGSQTRMDALTFRRQGNLMLGVLAHVCCVYRRGLALSKLD